MRIFVFLGLFGLGFSLAHQIPETESRKESPGRPVPRSHEQTTSPASAKRATHRDQAGADLVASSESSPHELKTAAMTPAPETQREVSTSVSNPVHELVASLHHSQAEVRRIPAYTAVLEQQVEVRGRLLDSDRIELKLRRSPFSVFMKWEDDGQEVLYVEGQNDGRLLAHPTKGFGRLRRVWRLTPDSPQAMKDCRYPVTEIGIENLTDIALKFYEGAKPMEDQCVCVRKQGLADGKAAVIYTLTFPNDQVSPDYATSELTFDVASGLLVGIENHKWGVDGNPGELLERYRYHSIQAAPNLTDEDFSEKNPQYHFTK